MNTLKSPLFVSGCILASLCTNAWTDNLPFGQTVAGAINAAAQSNGYVFNANANDVVDVTIVATSGALSPKIGVYNSAGTLITSAANLGAFGQCIAGSTLELNSAKLPTTDTYTILLGDCADTNTGGYVIYAQRVNSPSGAAAISFGQIETSTVNSAAQSNTFLLGANQNDVVNFTLVATSGGSLSPKIRVYDASGTQVSSAANLGAFGQCVGGSTLELNTLTLTTAGTYTLLVGDCGDTSTGTYLLYAQRVNNAAGAAALVFGGQPQTGAISSAAQSNGYVINGTINDDVDFTVAATSGNLSPKIRLYNPAGALIGSAANLGAFGQCIGGSTIALSGVRLPTTGTYTLLLGDCGDTNTGKYNLSGQCFGVCAPWPSPSVQSFDLTLQVSPATAGTIAATPASPTGSYASGTSVCLTASASSGWAFQGWAGDALDPNGCLVMDSDKSVTAIFVAVAGGTNPSNPSNPFVQVTSVPQFGALPGSIAGIVSGVSPSAYQIAPLIFLTGQGWYSKPYCDATTVALGQDGSFTALLTTGGVDQFATKIALILVPTSISVQCYSSAAGIPSDLLQQAVAQVVINRPNPNEREVEFAGQPWGVKASPIGSAGPVPIGPGGCVFSDSPDNVAVDSQGNLHLKIISSGGTWSCAEVYSRAAISFGVYEWTITGLPTLDPTSVFGAFTWADAVSNPRELDVEVGFSTPGGSTNSQYVVQPASVSGNLQRISLPTSGPITFKMTWMPETLLFQAFLGNADTGTQLAAWTYAGSVPPADQAYENFRFNLWLNGGPPASGQAQEAVISNFQYQPFVADPTAPSLNSFVNAASFVAGSSPGSIFTASGQNLANQAQSAPDVPLPTTLDSVTVLINGIPAPLFFVSPNQIGGQIPYIAPSGPSQVAITVNGNSSQVLAFPNIAAAPGIFTNSQNCLAQNPDQSSNTPNNPAAAGSVITAYLTGIGQVDNQLPSGAVAPSSPLSSPILSATAQLGGQPATLNFLGLVPGLVGVAQANLQIPSSAASGQQSLVITIGGVASNACPISVSNVNAVPVVISSLSPNSATAGGPAFTLTVNGTGFVNGSTVQWNGLPLSTNFVSATQLQAAVPAALLSSSGSPSVTVMNTGNVSSNAVTFTIAQPSLLPQTITFQSPGNRVLGPPFELTATASSGLPVAFISNTPAVCTVSGTTLTLIAAGTCSITASQAGNGTYAPAPSVTQSFTVGPVQGPPSLSFCDAPVALPRNLGLGSYSPALCFQYGGLQAQSYTLMVWLLETQTGNYYCASTQWCQATFTIDNTSGGNSAGQLVVVQNMDVYNYSGFLWVAQLGGLKAQQSASSISREPPLLGPIGNPSTPAGQPLQFAVSASDPNGYPLTYQAQGVPLTQGLPSGAGFNGATGTFSWPSPVPGTYQILLNVVESTASPLNDSELVTITVSGTP